MDRDLPTRSLPRRRALHLLLAGGLTLAAGCAPGGPGSPNGVPQSAWIGVSVGALLGQRSDVDLDREIASLRQAGVGSLRIDIDWSVVEPVRGEQDWASIDRVLAVAEKYSMTVLGVLAYTPTWAQRSDVAAGTTHGAPADPAQFAAFAQSAVSRYSSRILAWEVWNEPNLSQFWQPRPDPAGYADLVRQTYAAVKAVAPSSTVIAGALAPASDAPDGSTVRAETFAGGMYDAGAGGSFDALSVHPYSYPALPTDTSTYAWNAFQRLPLVHDVMTRHGDGGKKIWITEFGAPTSTTSRGVSEQGQSQIIAAGLKSARSLPWVGPVYVYNGRDNGTDRNDQEQNFGLLRADFSQKPAWDVVLAQARRDASEQGGR